jgi:DNA-binding winged helix-turn-helix (wHTH) protein
MAAGSFRFDRFVLDPSDRRLLCDGAPVELNGRYLDALMLLIAEAGRLVSKDRFHDEVWGSIPVTDEALTQCIRTLRRQLGDDAASPRFIETVPKHGYRFIAPVHPIDRYVRPAAAASAETPTEGFIRPRLLRLGGEGTAGGGLAGAIGGLIYGFAGASQPLDSPPGAMSILLVVLLVTATVASIGAAGVAFGIAASDLAARHRALWSVLGGAAGGLLVGAIVKLLGLDAFALLVGQSPGDITGAGEGALLGAAVGFGAWLARRARSLRRGILAAGLAGGASGALIVLLGGRLMAGSLALLADHFPRSRLRLDPIGAVLGEDGFGPLSHTVTGALEGTLFAACVVGAMALAERRLNRR